MSDDGVFAQLQAQAGPLWLAAQRHPFVDGLADGSLARERFQYFLTQDFVYLQAFSRATALACAKAPDLFTLTGLAALLSETLGSEMQLHRDYCASFGIGEAELAAARAAPVCQAYGDFMLATAALHGVAELLAALLPCIAGYAEIGVRLGAHPVADEHPYRQWIATYAGAAYQQYAQLMVQIFDDLARESGPRQRWPM